MTLTAAQLHHIQQVFVEVLARSELRHIVRAYLAEDLDAITSAVLPYSEQVADLLQWANERERVLDLLRYARLHKPSSARLTELWREAQTWQEGETTEPPLAGHEVREPGDSSQYGTTRNATPLPLPSRLTYRVDVAVPDQVRYGIAFVLAVTVRHPASPVLDDGDLKKVRSGNALLAWRKRDTIAQLRLEVIAPECRVTPSMLAFHWDPEHDLPVYRFSLVPLSSGPTSIIVQLFQDDACIGSASVRTAVSQEPVDSAALIVESCASARPLLVGPQLLALQTALVAAFSMQTLREMVAVYLDEDLEAIAGGGNLKAVAFNLIEWAQRTDRTHELIDAAVQANPHNYALVDWWQR
ncbi:MAG: hypothetical protein IPK16_04885 [Anaerolineales bacterium]|nr:hypothetical protein [Anaerolineales bacterium]